MVPGTVGQLAILLVLVLPGVFYQAVRERLRGALASEQEPQNRLVRAIAASALLDTLYAVVAGPWLVRLLAGGGEGPVAGVLRQPRQAGLAALLLIVAVPSALAWAEAVWGRRRAGARYEPTPTAWDALFRDRGSCFVRVRLRSGLWVGGWLGSRSAVSAFPQPGDLYLQAQYRMGPDGRFLGRMPGTAGVYVRADDVEVLEVLLPPSAGADGGSDR
ncbi:hypothetical protein AMK21_24925 [Streptomyces sp. CB00316]|uniref:DUF6338 family protein n=1 Tax=unclassified Streptomyces TaxID=2593676 RepID=UPI00093D809E|nr:MULTISPECIES: DUF6338 family protein [unclassified Streptomyces]MBT2381304.1 hypothetical protein [Streptomyces sp. ISL-111]MBT2426029.1 hypothetical protein [Streptomyces sp. ISL-112]MBT2461432.1 hypothetical protein [Streptomyces sp. ISL-63]OKJ17551.1 hypothetical protein AMK21_24925 [Streptomyces sp. CB00316]